MSSFSSDLDFGENVPDKINQEDATELQEFLQVEQYKAEMRAQIQVLTDTCWEKCIDKPQSKMDTKTESCLSNCVGRFVDVSQLITNRYVASQQKAAHGM